MSGITVDNFLCLKTVSKDTYISVLNRTVNCSQNGRFHVLSCVMLKSFLAKDTAEAKPAQICAQLVL